MLESIRKRRNSVVILVAFAAIIIVFIFWGVGPGGDGSDPNVVATVNGEPISQREYANLYKRELDYYKSTLQGQFTDEMAEQLNLKRRALDILINRALAIKEARAQGIKVSEAEVQEAIRAIPAFNKDGVFDKEQYFKVLSSNRINPAEFEKSLEADIITARIREKVLKDVAVTDEEVRQRYFTENRKVDLSFVAVSGQEMRAGMSVAEDEAREYLKANASQFMVPLQIKVFYAYAGYEDFARRAEVTDSELKEYYEKDKAKFEAPAAVKASHILVRPDPAAPDKDKAGAEARAKIDGVLKQLKAGADFQALARKHSEDPGSARQGGELGWFQKGVMIKAFEDAAFALKAGDVSGVVETEFGFHIIKVEEKRDAGHLSMKEVDKVLRKAVANEKAATLAREALTGLDASISQTRSEGDLKKAASSEKGLSAGVTGFFAEGDQTVEIATVEQLRDVIFRLSPDEGSRLVEAESGVYLVRVLERKGPHVPDYPQIASEVKDTILASKAAQAARDKAGKLLERLKAGEELAKAAASENLKVESTGYFSRADGFMPRTGIFVGDKDGLFSLDEGSPLYPEVLQNNGRLYLLRLTGVKEAPEAGLEGKGEEIKARVLAEKHEDALDKWLKGLREKSKVKINDGVL